MPSEDEIDEVKQSLKVVDLHPSLQEVVQRGSMNPGKLNVALRAKEELVYREQVTVTDGEKYEVWEVPSLRALFRGEKVPPDFSRQPTPEYMPYFYFIEHHLVTFSEVFGYKTDGEFEEAFSNLRRRPDGKSLNMLHFCLWQVAAGLLGKRPVSAAEFDAIFGRLTKSARTFSMGLVSRNYIQTLIGTGT